MSYSALLTSCLNDVMDTGLVLRKTHSLYIPVGLHYTKHNWKYIDAFS